MPDPSTFRQAQGRPEQSRGTTSSGSTRAESRVDWRSDITSRLGGLRLDPARQAEIIDELSQHLDERYDELLSEGATTDEAFRAAVSELRDAQALATAMRPLRQAHVAPREPRDPRLARLTAYLIQDGRFALRQLARSPSPLSLS
jgi:hypothetical protein